jgi:hypothetical protein
MNEKIETEKKNVTTVPAGQIGSLGWKKWGLNLLSFLNPVLSLYLGFVSTNLGDGLHSMDFVPNAFILGTMTLYLVNALQDLINKFKGNNQYVIEK